jgi:hypothetical protein
MALLFDEVVFEQGALSRTVGTGGMLTTFFHPPGSLSEADIRARRSLVERGEPYYVSLTPEAAPGVVAPGTPSATIWDSLHRSYFVEFTHLLFDLGLQDQPWVKLLQTPSLIPDLSHTAHAIADLAIREERSDRSLPTVTSVAALDRQVKVDLNRDLAWGAALGVPIATDGAREPLLDHKSRSRLPDITGNLGAAALRILVPDFTSIPWPDIIALHDHDAIGAFREKLTAMELSTHDRPPAERSTALHKEALEAMTAEFERRSSSGSRRFRRIAQGVGLEALSIVAPFSGTIIQAVQEVAHWQNERLEWSCVLLKLRSATKRE